ncbi:MAG: hypothetical protein MUC29_12635, partial [Pyrinomonadaceae bacterium]|nr:hypothetical protein [Pyrinomonadaceae bacterium]
MRSLFSERILFGCLVFCLFAQFAIAQKRPSRVKPKISNPTTTTNIPPTAIPIPNPDESPIIGTKGVVIDERLSVLRSTPSLYALPVQRMRTGRDVVITAKREADGVTFYRVNAEPKNTGWVQSDAIVTKAKRGDDERLAKLVNATNGFEQIELASIFLDIFTDSTLRPPILLLFGDLIEDQARKISIDATRKLVRREMAATDAPLHSFYLNYSSLDRYQKLGIMFFFNADTKMLHYNGKTWEEILKRFPKSS